MNGTWPDDNPTDTTSTIDADVLVFRINGVSFKLVKVSGGAFMMSSGSSCHEVTLTKDYYIGETEVTQALWQAVMGDNPSFFAQVNGYSENLHRPVESVSWYDCQTFISTLNELTGKAFRLPTEAEWEFAARGGNDSQGYKYAGSNAVNLVAWYQENSCTVGESSPDYGTHSVATKIANELGLYDMTGNVWEWCQDWHADFNAEPQIDPLGPVTGIYRVQRGGGWITDYVSSMIAYRGCQVPSSISNQRGLRLAL